MLEAHFDWLGVCLGTLLYTVFSGMWHRQFAFGKKWDLAMGFDRPEGWKESNIYYVVPFLGCLISSFAVGILHYWINVPSLMAALEIGMVVGVGIGATVTFTNAVIPIMKRPVLFGLITGTAHAFSLMLVSVVIFLV